MHPFTVQEIERTITFRGEDDYEDVLDAGDEVETNLRGALDALNSDCWDSIDGNDATIICYPADSHQNYRTGDWESTQVIIRGEPRNITRLLALYDARRR